MKEKLILTLMALFIGGGVWAISERRYYKRIDVGDLKEESLVSIHLDSDVYASSAADYADLRIVDERKNEVPYLVDPRDLGIEGGGGSRRELTDRVYEVESIRVESLRADKKTVITIKTRREPLTAFVLETEECNYRRAARVEIPEVGGQVISQGELTCLQLGGGAIGFVMGAAQDGAPNMTHLPFVKRYA